MGLFSVFVRADYWTEFGPRTLPSGIGQVKTAEIVHEIPRVIIGELAELSVVNISY